MRSLALVFALTTFASVATAQKLPLQIDIRPLFGTTIPPYGCLPLKIVIQNEGPPINATLVVSPSRFRSERLHLFPLSLPTGSRKEITSFPFVMSNTMSVSVRLEGVRGVPEQTISVTADENARLVVGVGDEIGGLEWLKNLNPQPPTTSPGRAPTWRPGSPVMPEWVWAYCRPEDLPDKAGALTGVSAIVLGTGAERLTMAQWQAIRRWVMMGGVLVVPGGSAAIYLRHALLALILPIQNWRTVQHSNWKELARWLQIQTPSEPAFITVGDLISDAELLAGTSQFPLVAIRPYGYGASVANLAISLLIYFVLMVPLSYALLRRKAALDWHWLIAVFTQIHDYGDFTGGTILETQDGPTVSTILRVPNLSFRLFCFAKPITLQGKVDVQSKRQGNMLQITVTNHLPFALKQVQCQLMGIRQEASYEPWRGSIFAYVPISTKQLPELSPQESATVDLSIQRSPIRLSSPLRLIVTAQVEGMDITPNLNTPSQKRSYVTLQIVRAVH